MSAGKLPEWPEEPVQDYVQLANALNWQSYYRQTSAYWESRCRLAVEALDSLQYNTDGDEYTCCLNALQAIGPLPEKQP